MSRSVFKGPFVDPSILRKAFGKEVCEGAPLRWLRGPHSHNSAEAVKAAQAVKATQVTQAT